MMTSATQGGCQMTNLCSKLGEVVLQEKFPTTAQKTTQITVKFVEFIDMESNLSEV